MPTAFDDQPRAELAMRLLARTPSVRNACDLDVLIFLHRHPRTLLTSERLAEFVGYDQKEIAKTLDSFIAAGLLDRTAQQSAHAARMFVLLPNGPEAGGARAVLELASTREGRESIREALRARGPRTDRPVLRLRLVSCA